MNRLSHRQIDALNRIERRPELQPFFFREVKGLKWFDEFQKRGFFSPAQNPMPEESKENGYWQVPRWPVLDYLVATAPELEEVHGDEYIEKYLDVIRCVTLQAKKLEDGNYRTWWQFARILHYIPLRCITLDDIAIFAYWLGDRFNRTLVGQELYKGLIKKLLLENNSHSRKLLLALLKVLTHINWVAGRNTLRGEFKPTLIIDSYYAKQIFKTSAFEIGKNLGKDGIELFRGRVTEILAKDDKDNYSYIWRPAIEDHSQNMGTKESLNVLISAFRDSVDGLVFDHPDDAVDYVSSLFENEYKTIHRVAIFTVSQHMEVLREVTSIFLTQQYFSYHYQHELFHFLKSNFGVLNPEVRSKVLDIVDCMTVDSDAEKEVRAKQLAYEKLIWLSAIKGQHDKRADELFEENLRVTGKEPDHPDFSSYMEAGWEGDRTPYQQEELLSRNIDDLIELLNTFREDKFGWDKPTMRGLAKELKQAVKTQPKKFEEDLDKFISVDFAYSCELIEAFRELWIEKKYDVDWHRIFHFCLKLIQTEEFWSDQLNSNREGFVANRSWIVGSIGELIKAGTRNDEHAFDTRHLPEAKELLDLLLENQEGEEFKTDVDAVFVAINSPRGKCVEAFINYALRTARVTDKVYGNHEAIWSRLQVDFERELARANDGIYEFCTLVANYLPNFLYLSTEWTIANLPNIFPRENRLHWLCAMKGYAYVNKVYKEIYDFMKVEGHFLNALDVKELKEKTKEKVIQNIVVGYLSWDENLGDEKSLIRSLLDRNMLGEINQVIWFLSGFVKHDEPELRKKIFDLWRYFDDKIDSETEEGKKLYSALCTWSRFVDDLSGEEKKLLIRAVPFAEESYHSYIVIEILKDLVDKFPIETGEIYLAMLEGCYPTYKQEYIEYILKKLFLNETSKGLAEEIVERYIKKAISFPYEYLKQLSLTSDRV